MLGTKKGLGTKGEDEAAKYLQQLGWRLVERNYRCKIGEIDIVVWEPSGSLVFVEVRSRSGTSHGLPEESVVHKKQNKIRLLANQYLQAHPKYLECPCRIDVIAVTFDLIKERIFINHIENAF